MKTMLKYALAPAVVLALGSVTPASAQEAVRGLLTYDPGCGASQQCVPSVTVSGTVEQDRDKRVLELTVKLKLALVLVHSVIEADGAAKSDIIAQQDNVGNSVDHAFGTGEGNNPGQEPPLSSYPLLLNTLIGNSFNGNSGIIQGNQDVGNMANQANVVAVAVSDAGTVYSDASSALTQKNSGNTVVSSTWINDQIFPTVVPTKTAWIQDSINGNSGVMNINQNAGNMNNQFNGVSMAIATEAVVALSEADLGQFNVGNSVTETNTVKFDLIDNSVNGNSGVTTVNQTTGNMNNQATVVSFAGIASIQ